MIRDHLSMVLRTYSKILEATSANKVEIVALLRVFFRLSLVSINLTIEGEVGFNYCNGDISNYCKACCMLKPFACPIKPSWLSDRVRQRLLLLLLVQLHTNY